MNLPKGTWRHLSSPSLSHRLDPKLWWSKINESEPESSLELFLHVASPTMSKTHV
jgi:hypothetical protein